MGYTLDSYLTSISQSQHRDYVSSPEDLKILLRRTKRVEDAPFEELQHLELAQQFCTYEEATIRGAISKKQHTVHLRYIVSTDSSIWFVKYRESGKNASLNAAKLKMVARRVLKRHNRELEDIAIYGIIHNPERDVIHVSFPDPRI
jgi:hypothetical protein